MSFTKWAMLSLTSIALTVGCASSKMKERREQRDKVAQTSKLYCEFVNGDIYPDIDVALNLEMAKQCDLEKPFSLTQYKSSSESPGVLYCCNVAAGKSIGSAQAKKAEKPEKKEEKKEEKKSDEIVE